jgi:hypothetical protein
MKKELKLLLTCLIASVSLITIQGVNIEAIVIIEDSNDSVADITGLERDTTIDSIIDINSKFSAFNLLSSDRTFRNIFFQL